MTIVTFVIMESGPDVCEVNTTVAPCGGSGTETEVAWADQLLERAYAQDDPLPYGYFGNRKDINN